MHDSNNHGWYAVFASFGLWVAGHITLSNIAFIVSIIVGVLQGWKTLRDIRKDKP